MADQKKVPAEDEKKVKPEEGTLIPRVKPDLDKLPNEEIVKTVFLEWQHEMGGLDNDSREARQVAFDKLLASDSVKVSDMIGELWAAVEAAYKEFTSKPVKLA